MGIGPVVKPAHGAPLSQSRAPYRAEQPEHPRQGREINLSRAYVEVSAWRHFEIELPIVKQGEFELAADLRCVRQIQEELSSAIPMGPTPIFRECDNIFGRIGHGVQGPAVLRRQRSA
jgi:hypothetical protein